ncbi:hypothetical protein YWS52_36170 [Chitiniphilus shinanonensis]
MISDDYTISIEVIEREGFLEIAAYARKIGGRDFFAVGDSVDSGFENVYGKIADFIDAQGRSSEGGDVLETMLAHVAQYKSNLYGFSLLRSVDGCNEYVLAVQEFYVHYFSLEMASFFSMLSEKDLAAFEQGLKEVICASNDNADAVELEQWLRRWKRINP